MTRGRRAILLTVAALAVGTLVWAPHGGGVAGRRARSIVNARGVPADPPPDTTDLPAPTTTTTTAPAAVSAPQDNRPVRPDLPEPATTLAPAAVIERPPPARPGHYACVGDDNATADCVNDDDGSDVTPNAGDPAVPADPAYAARLTADLCEVKPEFCP